MDVGSTPTISTNKKACLEQVFLLVLYVWGVELTWVGSADLRTDDAHSASPDSEQIEPAEAGLLGRNSGSVEQIQEKSHF